MSAEAELVAIFRAEVEEQLELLGAGLAGPPAEWDVEALFRVAHTVKGAARVVGADSLQGSAHALEDLFSLLRRGAPRNDGTAALARRGCELLGAEFGPSGTAPQERDAFQREVQQLLADGAAAGPPPQNRRRSGSRGERLRGDAAAAAPSGASAPEASDAAAETVRLHVAKIDALMPLAAAAAGVRQGNEAVQQHAARVAWLVSELARRHGLLGSSEMRELSLELRRMRDGLAREHASQERLVASVAEGVRGLRLVPIENLGRLLSRALRDACAQSGREARLEIRGGDTEVDRGVLEALRDPLVHLVRNAVAHGVEPAPQRLAAGKPAHGTVGIEARTNGSFVDLEVWDDGRGVDWAALRAAAAAEGRPDAAEAELVAMLFRPGFSTRAVADAISGRGVGLDVVRHGVLALGGEVSLLARSGGGTLVRLRVPLTRLTTRGLQVRLGAHRYVLPMGSIEATLLVAESQLRTAEGQSVVLVGERLVPVLELGDVIGVKADRRGAGAAVLLGDGARRRLLLVDEVVGEQECVLQPLAWNLRGLRWVSGCTAVHGAALVPVLDPAQLLEAAAPEGSLLCRPAGDGQKRRLLVVDDSVTSRTLEKNILSAAGYDVEVAVDGQRAWERLQQGSVDLLISDVEMPLVNGIELAARVRASRQLARLPVILVTSLGDEQHRLGGAEAGADAYIVKGEFDQDQLLKAVARLL